MLVRRGVLGMKSGMNETWTGSQIVVIMGISGAGKSTVGRRVAEETGGRFFDADDFHSMINVKKMRAGIALTDEDRAGWLEQLRDLLEKEGKKEVAGPLVLACSALKERYRDVLRAGVAELRFVFLQGSSELIRARLIARENHFMPESLIDSQLEALEIPEDALVVDVSAALEVVVKKILEGLRAE